MREIGLLSIVIPCHNEEEVLRGTHKRLSDIMAGLLLRETISGYELIFVDNGSTDQTLNELKALFDQDSHLRIISLRRNFIMQRAMQL
jgi:dolichol-phosphate mannosyltransferase